MHFFSKLNCFVGFVLPIFNIRAPSSLSSLWSMSTAMVSLQIRHLFASGPLSLLHLPHSFRHPACKQSNFKCLIHIDIVVCIYANEIFRSFQSYKYKHLHFEGRLFLYNLINHTISFVYSNSKHLEEDQVLRMSEPHYSEPM
jgi:hypothetical protein